jgi:hypothetical protein
MQAVNPPLSSRRQKNPRVCPSVSVSFPVCLRATRSDMLLFDAAVVVVVQAVVVGAGEDAGAANAVRQWCCVGEYDMCR